MSNVVITGGSRGIGAAAVKLFAARGDRVVFLYEKNHEAAAAVAEQTGGSAICCDVADTAAVGKAFQQILNEIADNYIYVVSSKENNVRELVQNLNKAFNGKGGGRDTYAQGKIVGTKESILDYLKFVFQRIECILGLVGIILISISLYKRGERKNDIYI